MPTVAIIDDQETTVQLLSTFVKNIRKIENIDVVAFTDEGAAISWLQNHCADLILLDYKLTNMNGLDIISLLRLFPQYHSVPIVMVTEFDEKDLRYRALDAGATDFLAKPVDAHECIARCTNLLTLRQHQLKLQDSNKSLIHKIKQASSALIQHEKEAILALARAGEFRDSDTGNHIIRIARYSRLIAEALALNDDMIDLIETASPMHDLGKIGTPDHILLKAGPLTPQEWEEMRRHTIKGHQILASSTSRYMKLGASIALHHHEKFDGTGYPQGLKGKAIPIEARIVALADVFDALTNVRPYKNAWPLEKAIHFIIEHKGTHFDPDCVDAFLRQIDNIKLIHTELMDEKNSSLAAL